jgi:hypothetical protein
MSVDSKDVMQGCKIKSVGKLMLRDICRLSTPRPSTKIREADIIYLAHLYRI